MFAIVRTGGKQYRVAAGDKIAVEKLAGEAGDTITLGDVILAGDEGSIVDAAKVSVSAGRLLQLVTAMSTLRLQRSMLHLASQLRMHLETRWLLYVPRRRRTHRISFRLQ